MHQSINVASNAKMIEVLKSEFIGEAADVIRACVRSNGRDSLIDSLGATMLLAYALAKRCGIGFEELDADIISKANNGIREGHKLETCYNDLSALKNHFESGTNRGFGKSKNKKA